MGSKKKTSKQPDPSLAAALSWAGVDLQQIKKTDFRIDAVMKLGPLLKQVVFEDAWIKLDSVEKFLYLELLAKYNFRMTGSTNKNEEICKIIEEKKLRPETVLKFIHTWRRCLDPKLIRNVKASLVLV